MGFGDFAWYKWDIGTSWGYFQETKLIIQNLCFAQLISTATRDMQRRDKNEDLTNKNGG